MRRTTDEDDMQRKRDFKPLGCTHIDGGTINPFGVIQIGKLCGLPAHEGAPVLLARHGHAAHHLRDHQLVHGPGGQVVDDVVARPHPAAHP